MVLCGFHFLEVVTSLWQLGIYQNAAIFLVGDGENVKQRILFDFLCENLQDAAMRCLDLLCRIQSEFYDLSRLRRFILARLESRFEDFRQIKLRRKVLVLKGMQIPHQRRELILVFQLYELLFAVI